MAAIQLTVVLCIMTLWAFLPSQARFCLSRCCNMTEVNEAGHKLTSRFEAQKYMPTSQECRASTTGHESQRSVSPWRYEKDEDSTRFPVRLWQAHCNCPRCIAFKPYVVPGSHRKNINPLGNSAVIKYTTMVFFRRQCEADPHQFKLVPEPYTVNVSCTCVFPEMAS